MLATFRDCAASLAAAWTRVRSAEERRFQESIGGAADDDEADTETSVDMPCSAEESATNLLEIVREREKNQPPHDLMYPVDKDASDGG